MTTIASTCILIFLYLFTIAFATGDRYQRFPSLKAIKPSTDEITQRNAVKDLIATLLHERAQELDIKINNSIPKLSPDAFELDSDDKQILITGSSGVAAAFGVHHYLKYYCKVHLSWTGDRLKLPQTLPKLSQKIHVEINQKFRYYFNACTFSYSMVWWDWQRWKKEIDWMALNGINMPLALTGQEGIWTKVYKKLGLTFADLDNFFTGPAFLAWNRMGNIQRWAGPLPHDWINKQITLQVKILDRMRKYGMLPILPAFNGNIPNALTKIYPKAKIVKSSPWFGFSKRYGETALLDPRDKLFIVISKLFIEEEIKAYGTDHLYSLDLFNEIDPQSKELEYLTAVSKSAYLALNSADTKAVWIMQGWMFYNDNYYWENKRIQAFLSPIPKGRIVILDLFAEVEPQYHRSNSFFGHPFIWCMLNNFGGNAGMYGTFETITEGAISAYDMKNSTMIGTGMAPEGIGNNYIMYDLMAEMGWRKIAVDVRDWVVVYTERRYGGLDENIIKAWLRLSETVYNCNDMRQYHCRALPAVRPSLKIANDVWYSADDIFFAWEHMLRANNEFISEETFQYDIVDVTRQALQELAFIMYKKVTQCYHDNNQETLKTAGGELIELFTDMDTLLGTNSHFLLGRWVADALQHSNNISIKQQLRFNALNQITLWGPSKSILHDYANKMWNGLVDKFYKKRWLMFIKALSDSISNNILFDQQKFNLAVQKFEAAWASENNTYATTSSGSSVTVSKQLFSKYKKNIEKYRQLQT
ncbi:uncharacterized protein TRIADDRAFT_54660 [Trichoplax adhaerens]|uniref:Alpha-N-acetylglucosaminidase n=1 Tax=Trichoplax adhaerens TaxID=10228 RepID=B3RSM6_TRIAD|nr:hypothetical protein TRIADDRAFT_54660 [Trichoplax adhaerens]EDV26541.1 hypothetical protein TRIADDRAFT_54660 [Trichoplax adhaerens]|eukprot:XP_002110537.1 hypothetical protein TRIADDRAFT_54660 [Trichoplax adhaerens]